jgi:hypothetical protein
LERPEIVLRRLASGATFADAGASLGGPPPPDPAASETAALARLAALIAMGATDESYREAVCAARRAGADDDDVIDVLLAVAPTVGAARVVAATPGISLALGYDLDAAFESTDGLPAGPAPQSAPCRPSTSMRSMASAREETPSLR